MSSERSRARLKEKYPLASRKEIAADAVAQIQSLYDDGKYIDAYDAAVQHAPLQSWQGADALIIASRLANNLSAYRLARLLTWRAHRNHPDHAEVALHTCYTLLEHRGPMFAWKHALAAEQGSECNNKTKAELLALRARIAGNFRDFDRAWQLINQAFELDADSNWLKIEKASVYQNQDARELALSTLDEVLHTQPWHRATIQYKARLLHVQNRIDEAIDLLTQALDHNQSGHMALQLMQLKREADNDEGMLELLDKYESLSPLQTETQSEWVVARRADAFYLRKDYEAAANHARQVKGEYYQSFADRLTKANSSQIHKRVRLPVRFVQQDHNTCGPATLAAIAGYLGREVTMDSIVGAICYDGTYDYQEREWCNQCGFAVKEFTVTWDSLRIVIDAGIPFALATAEIGSAHLQAVIGYDELRETIFIQDPSEPHYRETPALEFLKDYELNGPRGMVMVPEEQVDQLNAMNLQDAEVYDLNFPFHRALGKYDRETAVSALNQMSALDDDHRMVLLGRISLAAFDGNSVENLQWLERLEKKFPGNQRLLYWRLQALREHGRREDRITLLKEALRRTDTKSVFYHEMARELSYDRREKAETWRILKLAHASAPGDSSVLVEMGDWFWVHDRNPQVLDYYRFAASMLDKNEGMARVWFQAANALGKAEEVLSWMFRRHEAYGVKSSAPVITLASCLDQLCRTGEALQVLNDAIVNRPQDGELLLYTARLKGRNGMLKEAEKHLQAAKAFSSDAQWLRGQASLQQQLGNRDEALTCWQQILKNEPLALDAHRAVAHYLASNEGQQAAELHLKQACAEYPYHAALAELRLQWLRDANPKEALLVAQQLVQVHSENAWALRELALILRENGQVHEALKWSRAALDLAPDIYANHGIHGDMLETAGLAEDAEQHYRKAIELSVNYGWAYAKLIGLMSSTQAKKDALDFIRAEMIKQVLTGDALHAYRAVAFSVLEPKELVGQLREIWSARPDLCEAWSVLSAQEMDAGNQAEAIKIATQATEKFPLVPGTWRDLANLHRLAGEIPSAEHAIRKALDINPDWGLAWRELAGYLEDAGKGSEAVDTLRMAAERLPLDHEVRLRLALSLWFQGEQQQAWELTTRVVSEDPSQWWGWQQLHNWSPSLQRENDVVQLARNVTRDRPGEANSWIVLAKSLPPTEQAEILAAYDRAIACQPRSADGYDMKVTALVAQGRLNEAEQTILNSPWGEKQLPLSLKGRFIWLRAERGERQMALAQMLELLEDHADYYWGWEVVAELAGQLENHRLFVKA